MYTQLVPPIMSTTSGVGWCLQFTQTAFSAPVMFPSARAAWDGQAGRHVGEVPPKGIAVPVWLNHWGWYGEPGREIYANWGHAAVSLGDGRYLSSPMNAKQGGQVIFNSLAAMQAAIGGNATLLGWSEYMNGKQIVRKVSGNTPNTGQEEDEDMAVNSGIYWEVKSKPNTWRYATYNMGSGFFADFGNGDGGGTMPGTYNNALASSIVSTSWAKVTESHAGVIERACAAVRAGK